MTSFPERNAIVFEYLAKASIVAKTLCKKTLLYDGAGLALFREYSGVSESRIRYIPASARAFMHIS